ncbi:MAG: serine--tRNA ligase [Candidatus Caenarcaniphilales bacterium]|nr:serine--tRNA ligase [Candidatus Caenarcaniphilales bacterium]
MLDLKLIRKDPNFVKQELSKRSKDLASSIDQILTIDEAKREVQKQSDDLKSQRNSLSKSVKSKEAAEKVREEVQSINQQITSLDNELKDLDERLTNIALLIPNLPQNDVPLGQNESENLEIKQWGNPILIDNPKPHYEIAEELGILDFENSSKLAGSRFSTFIGKGVKLQRALIQFMLDEAANNGYLELSPPAVINGDSLQGTGQIPKFREDLYRIEGLNQYLIPTAEVPLTGFYAGDKPLLNNEIPKRLCAYTPCFRSEAGAAGKDTRGLIRQHQFDKIELVHICKPEDSEEEHEKLVKQAESILEKLELPYRKMLLCTGDMGFSAAKCYDLEVWFPSQNTYREISSCSNCSDFQARRLNLKFKRDSKGKPEFLYTLNGSGLAVGRTWAAIVENYQLQNKGFRIPQVLQKYLGGLEVID